MADLCAEETDAMYCTGQKSPNLNRQSTTSPGRPHVEQARMPRKQQSLLVDIQKELSLRLQCLLETVTKDSDVCGMHMIDR